MKTHVVEYAYDGTAHNELPLTRIYAVCPPVFEFLLWYNLDEIFY